jgi:phosphatidylglycerophosphatase A
MNLKKINLNTLIATGLYSGYLPKMPGTWGTLMGVLIWNQWHLSMGIIFLTFLLGWFASFQSLKHDSSSKDPSFIVVDEIVGILLTYGIINTCFFTLTFIDQILLFLLFRFFDIIKPLGIQTIDNFFSSHHSLSYNSMGIMIDDCVAALYSVIVFMALEIIWF